MKTILNNLTLKEFMEHGGIIRLTDDSTISFREYKDDYRKKTLEDLKEAWIGPDRYRWDQGHQQFVWFSNLPEVPSRDPYGIPGVNFTKIGPTDKRWDLYQTQRLSRGFDNSELWDLSETLRDWFLPRLRAYREVSEELGDWPARYETESEWLEVLDKIIKGFEEGDKEGLRAFVDNYGWLSY